MIPFFLFAVTALSTCKLVIFWAGIAGEQDLGFTGAAIMLLAAYISAFSLWAGRCIAALALALIAVYCLCENIGVAPRLINAWVVLSLLLLVVTIIYVVGSFRVQGVPNVLYPRKASNFGKAVAWMFIVGPLLWFAWWAFWHDAPQERSVTVQATWEPVTLQRVTSGRHQVKFTALDSSMTVTVASDELYDELQSDGKKSVDVVIKKTFKHDAMVAWSVETIDGHNSGDFSLLEQKPASTSDSKWEDLQVR